MQAEKPSNYRNHRDPEKHMIVEPERGAVAALQRGDEIMMVGPKDAYHHKGQRIDSKQCDELLEGHCVVREGKTVRHANFEDYNSNGDSKHSIRKTFDSLVIRMKFEWRAQTRFAFHVSLRATSPPSQGLMMAVPIGHGEAHHLALAGEDVVVRINQIDFHLVRTGRQTEYVNGIAVARVRP